MTLTLLEDAARKYAGRWIEEDRGYKTPCWVWQGPETSNGYGNTHTGVAHRTIYALAIGPIPKGLQLDHLCQVRMCVNPLHMEPVTAGENSRRGNHAKLTWDDVHAIRADQTTTNVELARRYGVSDSQISAIKRHKSWVEGYLGGRYRSRRRMNKGIEPMPP